MTYQADMFEAAQVRSQLDQLIQESRLFHTSSAYRELLDFVVQLRNFAPFNAMLLKIQKPGLRYAASRSDWTTRFDRTVKKGSRPLIIMWPFGPVALVYDLIDTEGAELPAHVYAFPAKGVMTEQAVGEFLKRIARRGVATVFLDAGDNIAGSIVRTGAGAPPKGKSAYKMELNQNHSPNTQFSTLAHELGHLFLGHQGLDQVLKVPARVGISRQQRELEAESVAYLVCSRHGVECRSESYLANYVKDNADMGQVDLYQVMRAACAVEGMLGLNHHLPS